jgi:GTP pyrophosphokinase
VFTPQGDLKSLPKGASVLDFAFAIHTDVGYQTRGAKVNGKIVALSRVLKSGDQVEIITSSTAKPTKNWLDYATTARARTKIKSALREKRKLIAEEGKEILRRKLKSQRISLNESSVNEMVVFFKLKTSLDLFYRVGVGSIDNKQIKDYASSRSNALMSFFKSKIRRSPQKDSSIEADDVSSNYDQLVFGDDEQKLDYKLSACCNPIPGDDVFGFTTIKEGIKVHKKNCPNAIQLQSNYAYRIFKAKWIDSTQEEFSATLKLTGIDGLGLVSIITNEISKNLNVNILNISFTSNDGIFEGKLVVKVKNISILKKLIERLEKIDGIDKVKRQ